MQSISSTTNCGHRGSNKCPDGSDASSQGGATGAGAAAMSRLALSRRQRRSLWQAGVILSLALGCVLVLQYHIAPGADAAGEGGTGLLANRRAWAAAAFWPWGTTDRAWAVAANVQTLLETSGRGQWDAVDRIHRLLAQREYAEHNQDCGRVLVYAQGYQAGLGSQVRSDVRLIDLLIDLLID
jgi:hypothetical protein